MQESDSDLDIHGNKRSACIPRHLKEKQSAKLWYYNRNFKSIGEVVASLLQTDSFQFSCDRQMHRILYGQCFFCGKILTMSYMKRHIMLRHSSNNKVGIRFGDGDYFIPVHLSSVGWQNMFDVVKEHDGEMAMVEFEQSMLNPYQKQAIDPEEKE